MKIIAFAIMLLGSVAIWVTIFIPKPEITFILIELLIVFSGLILLFWADKKEKVKKRLP